MPAATTLISVLLAVPVAEVASEPAPAPVVMSRAGPPSAAPGRRPRSGRGMLIAGGVLSGLGVVGRIGLEAFWSSAARIIPTDPFPRWSVPNVVFLTNWNNIMFFGPGLGLLSAGAYRRGRHDAAQGKVVDARRMRALGLGLLGGGLGLWALSRALFLPISDRCSNRCAYTTLEATFWISAGATFAGATHLAYGSGHGRGRAPLRVAPSFAPGFAGLAVAGRF